MLQIARTVQSYSASSCKDTKAIHRDVNCSNWAVMLCLQQNMLEVERPQTNIAVIRASDTEWLIDAHALQRQTYSYRKHTHILHMYYLLKFVAMAHTQAASNNPKCKHDTIWHDLWWLGGLVARAFVCVFCYFYFCTNTHTTVLQPSWKVKPIWIYWSKR